MNRIDKLFKDCKEAKKAALIAFIMAGDPDPQTNKEVIFSLLDEKLDLIELGIPFSDPTADGEAIQLAGQRALKSGMNVKKAIKLVEEIRERYQTPIVLFSYLNPILAYGAEKFCKDAAKAGADGLLIVDMPFEEREELLSFMEESKLIQIQLIAPTSPEDRIKKIAEKAEGFIYLVSMTGVTGSGGLDIENAIKLSKKVKSISQLPLALGFGIKNKEEVEALAPYNDGIIIGSAFAREIERIKDKDKLKESLKNMLKDFKKACSFKD